MHHNTGRCAIMDDKKEVVKIFIEREGTMAGIREMILIAHLRRCLNPQIQFAIPMDPFHAFSRSLHLSSNHKNEREIRYSVNDIIRSCYI